MEQSSTHGKGRSQSGHQILNRMGNVLHDPYISKEGYPEPAICPICNAVYHHKHWHFDAKLLEEAKKDKNVKYHKCPADRKIEDHYPMGKVMLSGSFIKEHLDEMINIIKNEERHAKENNPLDRLMLLENRNGSLYAETTSDALAMRIGHHLKNAYKCSDEEFKFRSGDKFVEIDWHKDQ